MDNLKGSGASGQCACMYFVSAGISTKKVNVPLYVLEHLGGYVAKTWPTPTQSLHARVCALHSNFINLT